MRRLLIMRRIVLPQAMRVIIPPTGNEKIGMLKTTSLVSVIASFDLLVSVQRIYNANYKIVPLLVVIFAPPSGTSVSASLYAMTTESA